MYVNPINMNIKTTFKGSKDVERFRESAIGLIEELKSLKPGSSKYELSENGKASLRERLLGTIMIKKGLVKESELTADDLNLKDSLTFYFHEFEKAYNKKSSYLSKYGEKLLGKIFDKYA